MRTWPILLLTLLAMSAFADRLQIPQLPKADYADTEVSTNIVFTPLEGSRKFTVEIFLNADMTNNVEVAVGCDCKPIDGDLSISETAITAGWNCGAWFFTSGGLTNRYEAVPSETASVRTLFMQIDIRENDTIRNITLTEDGESVFTNIVSTATASAAGWNRVKATSRGPTATSESITVKTNPYGLGIIFR